MPSIPALSANQSSSSIPPALQAQFEGVVDLIIVETVFLTLLFPVGVCLIMFTDSPEIRRKPVFILNVSSVVLGLIFGSMAVATVTRSVTGRLVSPQFITGISGLYFCIPICVQGILFVRILAAYPPRIIPRLLAFAIYGTLSAMMLARAVNIGVALKKITDTTRFSGNLWTATTFEGHVPSLKVELCMTLIYDIIASSLFLFRLHQGGALKCRQSTSYAFTSNGRRRLSYSARLRALFWIALTNFVLPVIFNTVLLIFVVRHENFDNIIAVIAVSSVNVYVQIISVLLATLWCSATRPEVSVSNPDGGRSRMIESVPRKNFMRSSLITLPAQVDTEATRTSSLA